MSLQEKASPSALIFIPHLLSALPRSFPLQPTDLGGEKHAKNTRPLQLLGPPPPAKLCFLVKGDRCVATWQVVALVVLGGVCAWNKCDGMHRGNAHVNSWWWEGGGVGTVCHFI